MPSDLELVPLAEALFRDPTASMTRTKAAEALVERLKRPPEEGKDRLGHAVIGQDLDDPGLSNLFPDLHPDLSDVRIVRPKCGIETTKMGGVRALNIITDVKAKRHFSDFYAIVNPFEWTKCALESSFFTEMSTGPVRRPSPVRRSRLTKVGRGRCSKSSTSGWDPRRPRRVRPS